MGDHYVNRRTELALRYDEFLCNLPVTLPWQHPKSYSSFHLYPIRLRLNNIQRSHIQVFESLRAKGIGVNVHYIPVHTQPYFERMGFKPDDFPQAQAYYREALSLPIYQTLTEADQERIITALEQLLT